MWWKKAVSFGVASFCSTGLVMPLWGLIELGVQTETAKCRMAFGSILVVLGSFGYDGAVAKRGNRNQAQ